MPDQDHRPDTAARQDAEAVAHSMALEGQPLPDGWVDEQVKRLATDEEYARGVWGDDALYCVFDRAWHHRNYHDANGYETQAVTGDDSEWVGHPPPTGTPPYCDLDGPDLIFIHRCDWYIFGGALLRKTVLSQDRWQVHQTPDGQLTVTPSIYCKACELHGFFAAGEWRSV